MKTKLLLVVLLIIDLSSATLSWGGQSSKQQPQQQRQQASTPKWGVVFGADGDIELAQYEIDHAINENKKYPPLFNKEPIVFYRDGWYRSVIIFDTKDQAQKAEASIKKRLRPQSYFIDIKDWCPKIIPTPQKSKGYSYYQC
jgi:hypothetical protein